MLTWRYSFLHCQISHNVPYFTPSHCTDVIMAKKHYRFQLWFHYWLYHQRPATDLSRVYPAARPMTAEIGSSTPRDPLRISGIEDDWLTVPSAMQFHTNTSDRQSVVISICWQHVWSGEEKVVRSRWCKVPLTLTSWFCCLNLTIS